MPDEAVWNSHQSGTQILGQYQVPHVGTVVPLFTKGHFYEHGLEKSVFEIKGAGSFHDIRSVPNRVDRRVSHQNMFFEMKKTQPTPVVFGFG